ncbi:MAG: hypothetical protein ABL861_08120 [Nitrosomonas sp.]
MIDALILGEEGLYWVIGLILVMIQSGSTTTIGKAGIGYVIQTQAR